MISWTSCGKISIPMEREFPTRIMEREFPTRIMEREFPTRIMEREFPTRIMEGGMKIQVIFYSAYGHIYKMAEAVAEGARGVKDAEVSLYQIEETLPESILRATGALEPRKAFAHIPVAKVEQLVEADAFIFGVPTRFGNMPSQMKHFFDSTGPLWAKFALVGKVGSVFSSSSTQHGGQETTITSTHIVLLHHGMIIVGLPYSEERQRVISEITGGTPYGVSTIAGPDGSRQPSENELAMARFQGRHVAEITAALVRGRDKEN